MRPHWKFALMTIAEFTLLATILIYLDQGKPLNAIAVALVIIGMKMNRPNRD